MSASVQVVLDTEPPTLSVVAEQEATITENWPVLVDASEDIGSVSASLLDAGGTLSTLGIEHLGPRTFRVLVPTAEAPGGASTLLLRVSDTVLNPAQVSVPVAVIRPQGYDVDFSMTQAFDIRLSLGPAFEVETDVAPAYAIDALLREAYVISLDNTPAYDVTLTIRRT